MPRRRPPAPPGPRAFWFAAFAFLAMAGLGAGFYAHLGLGGVPWGPVLLLSASHYGSWALLLGLVLGGLGRLLRSRGWFAAAATALLTPVLLFLYLDVTLYRLYRYHINGLVLSVVLGGAVGEDAHMGWQTVATFVAACAAILGTQLLFLIRVAPRLERLRAFRSARARAAVAAAVLAAVALDKGLYAWSDLANRPAYLAAARAFPLYAPLTMKRFAAARLGLRAATAEALAAPPAGSLLAYPPVTRSACGPAGPLPNFLVIVADSVRADLLDPVHMPRTAGFARTWLSFARHYSGGNATRYGLFSILYGLHGTYWDAFLAERRGPALIDALRRLDYDFKVISSTRLTWPELRQTGFAAIPGAVEDELGGARPAERDLRHPVLLRNFLDRGRRPGRPFFAFCFLDGPHAPYDYPDAYAKFQPAATHVNYLVATWQGFDEKTINRYRNAVLFDDALAGEMVDALRARGLLDRTVVAITSDHGEEFFETGRWGHTSAFTQPQCRVPLVLHVPGAAPRRVTDPTSHIDLAPTFLELAGCPALAASHTLGRSLLRPGPRDHWVVAGWHECGVYAGGRIVAFNTDFKRSPELSIMDEAYRPLPPGERAAALKAARPALLAVLAEQRKFLK